MHNKIIIIGTGIAAISAVKAVRETDTTSEITMYGKEAFFPYYRLKLSKNLFEKADPDKILIQQKNWYDENKINLILNTEITHVDFEKKEVSLSNGKKSTYDKLLIASGARNFIPNTSGIADIDIYSIRNIEDSWRIFETSPNKNSVLIVGGGVLGLEAAWIFNQNGKHVTVSEQSSRLMIRQLDEYSAEMLQKIIESYNVKVLKNSLIDNFEKNEKIHCCFKDGNTLDIDMVFFSTGITPNIDFLIDSEIPSNRGILIDKTMKTGIENVYAAGDVAEYEGKIAGLWNIAMTQGKIAGHNMVMPESPIYYENIISILSMNAFNTSLFSMGDIAEKDGVISICEIKETENKYTRIYINNGFLVGAIVIGDNKRSLLFKSVIEKKLPLIDVDSTTSIEELIEKIS